MIYLAHPYSYNPPMGYALAVSTLAHAKTFFHNDTWISPITLYHNAAQIAQMQTDAETWRTHNRNLLAACHKLVVVNVDGWDTSAGVKAELEWCEELDINVQFYDLDMNGNPRLFDTFRSVPAPTDAVWIKACTDEIQRYRTENKSEFGSVTIKSGGFRGQPEGPAEIKG